jgi:hypothetical protein
MKPEIPGLKRLKIDQFPIRRNIGNVKNLNLNICTFKEPFVRGGIEFLTAIYVEDIDNDTLPLIQYMPEAITKENTEEKLNSFSDNPGQFIENQ